MSVVQSLIDKRTQVHNEWKDVMQTARDDGWTDENKEKSDRYMKQFDELTEQIEREQKLEEKNKLLESEVETRGVDTQPDEKITYRDAFNELVKKGLLLSEVEAKYRDIIRRGDPEVLKGSMVNPEIVKRATGAQSTTVGAGGYTIPTGFQAELEKSVVAYSGMLQAARIWRTATGNTVHWPTVDDTSNEGDLETEGGDISTNTTAVTFSEKQFEAYVYSSELVTATDEVLQDSAFDFASIMYDLLTERVGRKVESDLTTANGSGAPNGIINAISSGYTTTGSGSIVRKDIINLEHSVDPGYRVGPQVGFMLHDKILSQIRQLSVGSADDRPLWQPSMREGAPNMIEGRQYWINQHMDDSLTAGSGNEVIIFGDFSKYVVRLVNDIMLHRLDERYAEYRKVAFFVTIRLDGECINTNALKYLDVC